MAREIPWNKLILEEFIKEALLTKEEEMIIRTRIAGETLQPLIITLNQIISELYHTCPTIDEQTLIKKFYIDITENRSLKATIFLLTL